MVALIPWWSRLLAGIVTIGMGLILAAIGGQYGLETIYVFYPVVIGGLILVEVLRPGGSMRSSGLGLTPLTARQLLLGSAIALVSIVSIGLIAMALGGRFTSSNGMDGWSWLPILIVLSAGEEVMFRGTIFEAIRERFGANVAVAITSVLFGVAHAQNQGVSLIAVVNVTCAGVLFGAMVVRTGSLWMSIAYHVAWNSILYLFIGSVSGSANSGVVSKLVTEGVDPAIRWVVDGPFGVEQGFATTIILIAGVVATAGWARPDRYVRAARLRRMRREHELSRP